MVNAVNMSRLRYTRFTLFTILRNCSPSNHVNDETEDETVRRYSSEWHSFFFSSFCSSKSRIDINFNETGVTADEREQRFTWDV